MNVVIESLQHVLSGPTGSPFHTIHPGSHYQE